MAFFEQENLPTNKPYKRKLIKDIQMDDEEIYVIGIAENKNASDEFTLNDETGKFPIRNIPESFSGIQNGKIYRILGRISLDGSATRFLSADHIQELPGFDLNIYKQSLNLKKEIK